MKEALPRYTNRDVLCVPRTFSVDRPTDDMLRVVSGGKMSAWLRRIVAIEYGKLVARGEAPEYGKIKA